MLRLIGKGIRRVFTKGPFDTLRCVRYKLYERRRERWLGIESEESDSWADSLESADHHVYEPLSYQCIDTALARLEIRLGADVFLDYGSGKGRIALTAAATHPFKRVIGVELLEDLNRIARENAERARPRFKCDDVSFLTADATQYEIPPDVNVFFLFNPFLGDVLRAVQQRIRGSLAAHPRRVQLVYMNPLDEPNLFSECEWLSPREQLPVGQWDGVRFTIYENTQWRERAD